tara:strand:- start:321 stop:569 length:249 start_codon:yes stop_codon:yes gene_type:complete
MKAKTRKNHIGRVHRSYYIQAAAMIANSDDAYLRRIFIEEILSQLPNAAVEATVHELLDESYVREAAQTLQRESDAEASRDE